MLKNLHFYVEFIVLRAIQLALTEIVVSGYFGNSRPWSRWRSDLIGDVPYVVWLTKNTHSHACMLW